MNFSQRLRRFLAQFGFQQLLSSVLIPGCILLGSSVLMVACLGLGSLLLLCTSVFPLSALLGLAMFGLLIPVLAIIVLIGLILFLGHQWRTIGLLQSPLHEAGFLRWNKNECIQSFVSGLHLTGYAMLIFFTFQLISHGMSYLSGYQAQAALLEQPIMGDFEYITYDDSPEQYLALLKPMFFSVLFEFLLFSLLFPFILAPVFYNAGHPNVFHLLKTMVPSWRWMLRCYPQILGLTTCGFSMLLVGVLICSTILAFTVVGVIAIPFVLAASVYLMTVFLTRAYPSPFTMVPELASDGKNNIKNI